MNRYIITSATPGCAPNVKFLRSLSNYCRINKSKLLIIPTQGLYKKDELSEDLNEYGKVVYSELELNNNLLISNLPINPDQVDPITGLDRLTSNTSSIIYSSPKQRMKSVASPSSSYPRVLMTPGSCTNPHFKPSKRSLVSAKDHVLGAIVVEVENSEIYHYRQVQSDGNGNFIDLGLEYSQVGPAKRAKVAAIIPGDWHTGYTDQDVKRCIIEAMKELKPDYLFLHDFFDGISVNHHVEHKYLAKGMMGNKNDLKAELKLCSEELVELSQYPKKETIIVKSNHDEFLDRWLEEGKYLRDSTNHVIGLELALAKAQGNDPIKYGLNKFNKFINVTFLKSDESYRISKKRIECGVHGHLGPNGSRGSAASIEKSYGNAVMGHSHSPERLRGTDVVGTSTHLKLSYNKGPSSWMQTFCIVNENGSKQLINIVNKKWRA